MRITKPGRIPAPWAGKWRCRSCDCEWELTSQDQVPERFYDQQQCVSSYRMPCPTCKYMSYGPSEPAKGTSSSAEAYYNKRD